MAEEEEPEALHDGDGNEIFGDHDKLWFKAEPPETDIKAYNLYTEIDQKKTISTDGYFDGKLALLYHARKGGKSSITLGYFNPSILKYLTQKMPTK